MDRPHRAGASELGPPPQRGITGTGGFKVSKSQGREGIRNAQNDFPGDPFENCLKTVSGMLTHRRFVFCDSEESSYWSGWNAPRNAVEAGGPRLHGAYPSRLRRLGVDLPVTRPVWDSNLKPPASESRSFANWAVAATGMLTQRWGYGQSSY